MSDTRVSGDISVAVMLRQFDCRHTGFLSLEAKRIKFLSLSKNTWISKYFIISKGAKEDSVCNLHCYANESATKQEWSISMREVESILEYNTNIVGIRIIFSDHTKDLILKCDTAKNRKTWLEMFEVTHEESQPLSADSGFGSGGSVTNSNWKESERATKETNDYDYCYAWYPFAAREKKNSRGICEPSCSNENDPNPLLQNNGKDDVLRRPAAKSRNEKSQNRNKVIVGIDKDMPDLVLNETCLKHEDNIRVFKTKDNTRSAKVKDIAATDEWNRNTDITCVKENLQSPIQETKSCRRYETQLATPVYSKHKINYAKKIVQAQSDDYENFELGQDENTRPKLIFGNTDFEYTMTDSDSLAFISVAGRSDSFVSVGQSQLDSDSHFIGTSEGDKKSDHVMIKANTFKSLQMDKPPENKRHIQKHSYLPQCQKYPPNPLSKFGKKDRVPPSSVRSIKDEGVESSNCICSKHDENNTTETSGLPKEKGEIYFHQASAYYSQQTKSADSTKTEKTQHILNFDLSIDDEGIYTYENTTFFENKQQNKASVNENETKRGSNSSTGSTSSSGSSADSVTYESPDEGAHYENMIILREEEYICERVEDVKRNLQHNPSGTFLICISGSVQKLWFVTDNGRRYFIIQRQGEKLSLYKNCSKPENMFDNLKQLLYFYHLNDLPSKSYKLKLKRAYKSAKKN